MKFGLKENKLYQEMVLFDSSAYEMYVVQVDCDAARILNLHYLWISCQILGSIKILRIVDCFYTSLKGNTCPTPAYIGLGLDELIAGFVNIHPWESW